jgi:hypothetical protein
VSAPPPPATTSRFRVLLDDAVRLVRLHFRTLFLPIALPVALLSAAVPALQGIWMRTAMHDPEALGNSIPLMVAFVAAMFLLVVAYLLGYTAMMAGAVDAAAGREVSVARGLRFAVRPRVLVTLIGAWLAIVVGMVFCCLPGIYLALLLSILVPVMVEEGQWGIGAMGRSMALVAHNPARDLGSDPRVQAFIIVVAGTLLSYGLSLIVQVPFIVAQQVVVLRSVGEGRPTDPRVMMDTLIWLQAPGQFTGTLAQMAAQLFLAFALALFYFDLRRRKEGEDLQAAIDRIAGAPTPA